jgi:HK97 family phage major capsid protein
MNNQTILEKADMALSDLTSGGGYLQDAQAARFIRILIDEAVIMKLATVVAMKSPKQLVEKIKFGSRILHIGAEATALSSGNRASPTTSKVELNASLFKAEVDLDNEVLEDSIERGQLRNTIMTLMAERIAVDMDDLIVRSDTTGAGDYVAFNGLLKAVTSNVYDHLDTVTNRALFKAMLKLMPSPFVRNKKQLRFLTSIDSEIDFRDILADRGTVMGDKYVQEDAPVAYSGVPITSVPLFPENIGTGTHCTNVILTDPKNINVGIWRDIKVETDKDISAGVLKIVASIRFDMKLAEETAVVKATNVKVV